MSDNKNYKNEKEEEVFYEDEKEDYNYSLDLSWEGNNAWIWGVVLLVGGAALLAQNLFGFTLIRLTNWWAIFILVPGLAMLTEAWNGYQKHNSLTERVRRRGLGGFILTAVAATFFFNLSWQLIGPVFLIALGIFLLFGNK